VEFDAVYLQQGERGQRYVDDETIDRQMGVVRNAPGGAQGNTGCQAEEQQCDIAHGALPMRAGTMSQASIFAYGQM
jgi:hypothetical protein